MRAPSEASTHPFAGEALRACTLAPREARALLAQSMGVSHEALIAHPQAPVPPDAQARFASLVEARRRGMPMAYLLGRQEFYGLAMRVTRDVLIPRPETELLVETALAVLVQAPQACVLELGTGSGCVAVALARARPQWRVVATDLSEPALAVARENCRTHGVDVALLRADWYAPLAGRFDLVVSNPPYVASGDPHLADLAFEPCMALSDGGDGLAHLRTIVNGARVHLARGGRLLVEHGYDQGAAVLELARSAGFASATTLRDLAGQERACLARTA
jgi:release factor glutamine methyltransferase